MGLITKSSFFISAFLFMIVLSASAVYGDDQPKSESMWIGKALHHEELEIEGGYSFFQPAVENCTKVTYYTRNLPLLPYSDEISTNCAKRIGRSGYIDGDNLLVNGGIAGKHYGVGRHYRVIDDSDAVLVQHGNYVRLIDNFTFLAQPDFNFVTGRLNYTLPYSPDQLLRDAAGRNVSWSGGRISGVSRQGNLFIDQANGAFIRVNEASGEVTLFGSGSFFRAGGTTRNKKFIQVAGNGRYIIVAENKARAVLYDLNRCSGAISRNTVNDVQSYYSEKCDYIALHDYLSNEFNDDRGVWIEDVDFDTSSQLWAVFGYRDHENITHTKKVRIAPKGYELKDRQVCHVALGDSFASGEGDLDASWYELGTDVPENKCHLSRRSYPYLLKDLLRVEEFHSVACSGAVTSEVISEIQKDDLQRDNLPNNYLGDWYPGIRPQTEYLKLGNASIVTVSISGNDAGFAGKLKECVVGPGTCKYAEEGEHRGFAAKEIVALKPMLVETYKEIFKATDNKTKLFTMSYPKFIKGSGGSCGLNVRLNDSEREFIDKGVELLNQVIKSAAQETGAHYINIENAFEGRNLCSDVGGDHMAVNGITNGNDVLGVVIGNESYHPNQNGHTLIADKFLRQTNYEPVTHGVCEDRPGPCEPSKNDITFSNEDYWGQGAVRFVNKLNENPFQQLPRRPQTRAMIIGDYASEGVKSVREAADVFINGLKPSSWVDFVMNSEPIELGSYQVDSNGSIEITIPIPAVADHGIHTLNAYGFNGFGDEVHFYEHVAIADTHNECGVIPVSGVDQDNDDIDDACDPVYISKRSELATVDTEGVQQSNTESAVIESVLIREHEDTEPEVAVWTSESVNTEAQPDSTNDNIGNVLGSESAPSVSHKVAASTTDQNHYLDKFVVATITVSSLALLILSVRHVFKN